MNAYQRTNLFNQQQQQHPQPFSTTIPVPHNNISSSLMINGSAANINNNNNPMAAFTNASQLNGSLIIPNCTLSAKVSCRMSVECLPGEWIFLTFMIDFSVIIE